MIAAESVATARALIKQLAQPAKQSGATLRLVHAAQLSGWALLAAAGGFGYPWWFEDRFLQRLDAGVSGATLAEAAVVVGPPTKVVRRAVLEMRPDLLVLGWHRHLVTNPLVAHSTAWRLSRAVSTDVLLIEVEAAAI